MRIIPLLLVLALSPFAAARAEQVILSPAGTEVAMRAYGLGLIPFDGKFIRFQGVLRYDPAHPQLCQVMLEIDSGSLAMTDASVRDTILGPEFMDAARFPDMAFEGGCAAGEIVGTLRLHGQTHPFNLQLARDDGRLIATGRLERKAWGITAWPIRVGATIRIRVTLPEPLGATALGRHG